MDDGVFVVVNVNLVLLNFLLFLLRGALGPILRVLGAKCHVESGRHLKPRIYADCFKDVSVGLSAVVSQL